MKVLGIEISLQKSLIAKSAAEFAKAIYVDGKAYKPFPPTSLYYCKGKNGSLLSSA